MTTGPLEDQPRAEGASCLNINIEILKFMLSVVLHELIIYNIIFCDYIIVSI